MPEGGKRHPRLPSRRKANDPPPFSKLPEAVAPKAWHPGQADVLARAGRDHVIGEHRRVGQSAPAFASKAAARSRSRMQARRQEAPSPLPRIERGKGIGRSSPRQRRGIGRRGGIAWAIGRIGAGRVGQLTVDEIAGEKDAIRFRGRRVRAAGKDPVRRPGVQHIVIGGKARRRPARIEVRAKRKQAEAGRAPAMMSRAVVIQDLDDRVFELGLGPAEIEADAAIGGDLHQALPRHAVELFLIGQLLIRDRAPAGLRAASLEAARHRLPATGKRCQPWPAGTSSGCSKSRASPALYIQRRVSAVITDLSSARRRRASP